MMLGRPASHRAISRPNRQPRDRSLTVAAFRALAANADGEMVTQVLAHARKVMAHVDAVLREQRRGPDPGKLQQLRRAQRPAGQQDLLTGQDGMLGAALPVTDAGRAPAVEQDRDRFGAGPGLFNAVERRAF